MHIKVAEARVVYYIVVLNLIVGSLSPWFRVGPAGVAQACAVYRVAFPLAFCIMDVTGVSCMSMRHVREKQSTITYSAHVHTANFRERRVDRDRYAT